MFEDINCICETITLKPQWIYDENKAYMYPREAGP